LAEAQSALEQHNREWEDLQEQQDLLDRQRAAAEAAAAAAAAAAMEVQTNRASEQADNAADDAEFVDPSLLQEQKDEIARLMDLLDEESERRAALEDKLAKGRRAHGDYDSDDSDVDVDDAADERLPGLPLDAELELSLEAELTGGGVSLADELEVNEGQPTTMSLEAELAQLSQPSLPEASGEISSAHSNTNSSEQSEEEDDLPPTPPPTDANEETSPCQTESGESAPIGSGDAESLTYERLASEREELLADKKKLENDLALARANAQSQVAADPTAASASVVEPTKTSDLTPTHVQPPPAEYADLHRQFPRFDPTTIDAMVAANGGDIKQTIAQLRQSESHIYDNAASAKTVQVPSPVRKMSLTMEQRRQQLLAKKKAAMNAQRAAAEKANREKLLREKALHFKRIQEEAYKKAQTEFFRKKQAQMNLNKQAEASIADKVPQLPKRNVSEEVEDREFKVVLPSQVKDYEALMVDDDYGAAKRLGLGTTFDGRVVLSCNPTGVHLVPNIKRRSKSNVHMKAWQWRLGDIREFKYDGAFLEIHVWSTKEHKAKSENYKFKIKQKGGAQEVYTTLCKLVQEETARRDASIARDLQKQELRRSGRLRNLDKEFMRELRFNEEFLKIMSGETGVSVEDLASDSVFRSQFDNLGKRSHKKIHELRRKPASSRSIDPVAERRRSVSAAEKAERKAAKFAAKKQGSKRSDTRAGEGQRKTSIVNPFHADLAQPLPPVPQSFGDADYAEIDADDSQRPRPRPREAWPADE